MISNAFKTLLIFLFILIIIDCYKFNIPNINNKIRFIDHVKQYIIKPLKSTVAKPGFDNTAQHNAEFEKKLDLGVLFLNLGGPESIQDVEGFLFNLFADPDIIRLPPLVSAFQKPIAYFISKRRAPKSSKAYESIGGGSPIVQYTRKQSKLVQDVLQKRGFERAKCYFAMRYWHPFTDETLRQIQDDGVNTLVVVPLYPQFSISTSGSSLRVLEETFSRDKHIWGPDKVAHTVVPSWYHRPGYIRVMARLIVNELKAYSSEQMKEGLHVLFSAHGVPMSYIDAGDPYQRQIEECTRLIQKEVAAQLSSDDHRPASIDKVTGLHLAGKMRSSDDVANDSDNKVLSMAQQIFDSTDEKESHSEVNQGSNSPVAKSVKFHLSYQSRVGPVKWLQPYTEDKLKELGEKEKVENLVVVPISFVSEHIETLEEIDLEYRELAEECGIKNWRRAPALNTDDGFIEDMADLIEEALESPTLTVAEASASIYSDMIEASSSIGMNKSPDQSESFIKRGLAMISVLSTSAVELINHHPVLQMLGFK